jgi:NAD(P)-dependent dehydrogenase (short-subunit alcohol dehydrogenase family)
MIRPAAHLAGRHAVVTGGGRGIGAAIARALAARGAVVTVMGRTLPDLQTLAATLTQDDGVRARAVACDVTDPASVTEAFADAVGECGPVRILVNNAGVTTAASLADTPLEVWDHVLRVNLTGAFLCAQAVLPAMLDARAGRIVNVASTAGLKGYPKTTAYCASKHGLVGFTRALAVETARAGITVNAVCPGYVEDTAMLALAIDNVKRATGRSDAEARAIVTRPSPRGALVTSREVADTVAWLCSDEASAITGQAVAVAAGEVM